MATHSNEALRERGGVPLRDYRQSGYPRSIIGRLRQYGWRGTLSRINFSSVGHTLVLASMGLGLLELLLPKRVQNMAGVEKEYQNGLVRLLGLREISSGMLTYAFDPPHLGIWSRVLGDAMDLGLLARIFTLKKAKKGRTAAATAFIAGVTALDVLTAVQLRKQQAEQRRASSLTREDLSGARRGQAYRVVKSITIHRPVEELYAFWRNFENLPRFMYHLQEVRVLDDRRSHWVTSAPAGKEVEWDAVITDDRPNERISWESMPGSQIPNAGMVRFFPAPAGRGTVVRVEMEYHPPAGPLGRIAAMFTGEEAGQQVGGDLRRFKNVMETGEVVRSDASPRGTGQRGLRPAQPLEEVSYEPASREEIWTQGERQTEMERQEGW